VSTCRHINIYNNQDVRRVKGSLSNDDDVEDDTSRKFNTEAKYAMAAFSSKRKYENIDVHQSRSSEHSELGHITLLFNNNNVIIIIQLYFITLATQRETPHCRGRQGNVQRIITRVQQLLFFCLIWLRSRYRLRRLGLLKLPNVHHVASCIAMRFAVISKSFISAFKNPDKPEVDDSEVQSV